jgi:hypothetical protein
MAGELSTASRQILRTTVIDRILVTTASRGSTNQLGVKSEAIWVISI